MDADRYGRVVLVHDWLTGMRGGEKCLEVLCQRWPDAPLYTLLHRPGSVAQTIASRRLCTSWMDRLPSIHRYYRYLLPLMPATVKRWRLPPCDLVISLSHCVAKAAQAPRGVPHVCYCFTPMRYAWHLRDAYFAERSFSWLNPHLLDRVLEQLREWDRQSAVRVSHFIAISRTVQERIRECYDRDSVVIYPPVDTDFYTPAPEAREDYYLVVSALAPYKRVDLALAACAKLRKPLVIIGSGQEEKALRKCASPGVHFLGWQSDTAIRDHLRRCRALLFPGEEDFGIVPLEAQACGAPVIAFGRGGATETVVAPGGNREPTGLWFDEQTADCLAASICQFEAHASDFSPGPARRQSLRFSRQRFADDFFNYLDALQRPAALPLRRAA